MYIYIYMYICTYVHMYICTCIYIDVCVLIHMYIYIYIYAYTAPQHPNTIATQNTVMKAQGSLRGSCGVPRSKRVLQVLSLEGIGYTGSVITVSIRILSRTS